MQNTEHGHPKMPGTNQPETQALEALYRDLDSFIHELNVGSIDDTDHVIGSIKQRPPRKEGVMNRHRPQPLDDAKLGPKSSHLAVSPLFDSYVPQFSKREAMATDDMLVDALAETRSMASDDANDEEEDLDPSPLQRFPTAAPQPEEAWPPVTPITPLPQPLSPVHTSQHAITTVHKVINVAENRTVFTTRSSSLNRAHTVTLSEQLNQVIKPAASLSATLSNHPTTLTIDEGEELEEAVQEEEEDEEEDEDEVEEEEEREKEHSYDKRDIEDQLLSNDEGQFNHKLRTDYLEQKVKEYLADEEDSSEEEDTLEEPLKEVPEEVPEVDSEDGLEEAPETPEEVRDEAPEVAPEQTSRQIPHTIVDDKVDSIETSSIEEQVVDDEEPISTPDYAMMSQLAGCFVAEIRTLVQQRKIFSTTEYPYSFTGEEAVDILREILPEGSSDMVNLKIARSFMHTTPPVVSPIAYSLKSMRRNTVYNSPQEIYTVLEENIKDGFPQGVFTNRTQCYTGFCRPGEGGCYAPRCPHRPQSAPTQGGEIQRRMSFSSSVASSHDTSLSRAWSAGVPREVLQNIPESEIKRQEAIHELIYTEEDYLRDLNLLHDLFAEPLRTAQCLEAGRRDEFCDSIFNNYNDILEAHRDLCRDLRDHQSTCQSQSVSGLVDKVGDIFLRYLPKLVTAYAVYGPHVVLAEYFVKREMEANILFQNYIREKEKQAETRKLPFRHFIILPVTRLQRYPLLMNAILKKTPDGHPDKAYLSECIEIIRSVAMSMDEETETTKNTLRIYKINDRIRYKPNETMDLQLLEPGRKLLHEGRLTRRSHMVVEQVELHIFIFDHLLLMTRLKKVGSDDEEYHISKRPIPLELLLVPNAADIAAAPHRTPTTVHGTRPLASNVLPTTFSTQHAVAFYHLGRQGGEYLFYADNADARHEWKRKLLQAKDDWTRHQRDKQVFDIRPLNDSAFSSSTTHTTFNKSKVTCSVQFVGANGKNMIVIGAQAGIWIAACGEPAQARHVLNLSDVTQMAVLEKEHVLVVLADKVLYAYALVALDPSSTWMHEDPPCYKITQHVNFFNAGTCANRSLVIAMKRRGMDSHFKAYEPVCGDLRDHRRSKFLTTKSGFFSKQSPWFKLYKEFYIGADSYGITFLRARVVVICARGFEIIDLEHLSMNRNLPDLDSAEFAFIGRMEHVRPLGMFRCGDDYLLCYDQFAFLVNSHGALVQHDYKSMIWEGIPQAVAFQHPYVLGFDPRFIEVRHVETGELVQILGGEQMRCLQYNSDHLTPIIHGCMVHPQQAESQYIFQAVATFAASS